NYGSLPKVTLELKWAFAEGFSQEDARFHIAHVDHLAGAVDVAARDGDAPGRNARLRHLYRGSVGAARLKHLHLVLDPLLLGDLHHVVLESRMGDHAGVFHLDSGPAAEGNLHRPGLGSISGP